jgi:hypothetical protein
MADDVRIRETTQQTISQHLVGAANIFERDLPDETGTVAPRMSATLSIQDLQTRQSRTEKVFAGSTLSLGVDRYCVVTVEEGSSQPGVVVLRKLAPLDVLVDDARRGKPWIESRARGAAAFDAATAGHARARIETNPDHTSYHLLLALRQAEPEVYARIAPATRAAVLCSALEHLTFYNDFGYLDPSGSHDGEAARALLELGPAAAPCLRKLLEDRTPAPLFGSEEATMSSRYRYRRADFAYRYLLQLRGEAPRFLRDPAERDALIQAELANEP